MFGTKNVERTGEDFLIEATSFMDEAILKLEIAQDKLVEEGRELGIQKQEIEKRCENNKSLKGKAANLVTNFKSLMGVVDNE